MYETSGYGTCEPKSNLHEATYAGSYSGFDISLRVTEANGGGKKCALKKTIKACLDANKKTCAAWVSPPANVDRDKPTWEWWKNAEDGTPYCCADAHDRDGERDAQAADGFDDTDMLATGYSITYKDCPDRATTFGASLGYSNFLELAATLIVLPLLMAMGVLNRDSPYLKTLLAETFNDRDTAKSIASDTGLRD